MLKETIKFNNLGEIDEIMYLMLEIISQNPISVTDARKYCKNNAASRNFPFEGIVFLLKYIDIINFENDQISLSDLGKSLMVDISETTLKKFIIAQLLSEIISEREFFDFNSIKYDYFLDSYIIKNNHISFKYSSLKKLLLDLDFFSFSTNMDNILLLNKIYEDQLKILINKEKRVIDLMKFKEMQELKEKYGLEAELFVLNFEKKRLDKHLNKDKIKQISEIDVSAGYDLISFNSVNSQILDRYIEVKSYTNQMEFYWSKNEIEVAKQKGENYFLYLVNREFTSDYSYVPHIICNPYKLVYLNNEYKREAQNWLFHM